MNFLKNICCCRQKQKPPQSYTKLPISLIKTRPTPQNGKQSISFYNKNTPVKSPISQPFHLIDKYKGQQLNGLAHGNGQIMYKNGDYYRGQWVNGQKQGRGLQIYHQKNYKYQGQWKSNLPNGQGKIMYQNGSYYFGQFKQNNKHGKGEFYNAQKKCTYQQHYQNGTLKKQHIIQKNVSASRQQQFPTLVLDKQRFNSQDLQIFQKQNPQIKQLQVNFLTKYYSICKLISKQFIINKNIKQWQIKQVNQFLETIQLSRCKQIFYKNKIKGNHLITISQKEMKEDLMLKLGDRKRLIYYIKYLNQIYNQENKKKKYSETKRKNSLNRQKKNSQKFIQEQKQKGFNNNKDKKHQKFITSLIEQQDIIQQQNQLGSSQIFQRSQKFSQNFEEQLQYYNDIQGQKRLKSPKKNKQYGRHNNNNNNNDNNNNNNKSKKNSNSDDNSHQQHGNKYLTGEWNQSNLYNSIQIHSLHQAVTNHKIESLQEKYEPQAQSEKSSWSSNGRSQSENNKNDNNKSNNNGIKILSKKNSEEIDQMISNMVQKSRVFKDREISGRQADMSDNNQDQDEEESWNQRKNNYDNDQQYQQLMSRKSKKSKKSNKRRVVSSSSDSSTSSKSSVQAPQLLRKRTTAGKSRQGGMQIRQLYQFLRQRGNLEFIIKQREIQILQLIGEGSYGKVYKGKYMSCPVAVKDYIKTGKHQIQDDFLKQLQILSDLKHPNIVLYMGICITADKYQLVTQYLQNGSLFDSLHKKKTRFTRSQILQIIDDIVKGMVYLHNMKNIMHRDLKSSNVLLDQDLKVKLCDFGLSGHKKKSNKKNNGRIGTYQWMAPEVMKKQQMDFSSDVYSFGVIIWELLTYKIPYQGYKKHQIIGQVGYDDNYKLKIKQGQTQWPQTDFIVLLMNECLNRQPIQRPTFIQIQSKLNEYFSKMIKDNKQKQSNSYKDLNNMNNLNNLSNGNIGSMRNVNDKNNVFNNNNKNKQGDKELLMLMN